MYPLAVEQAEELVAAAVDPLEAQEAARQAQPRIMAMMTMNRWPTATQTIRWTAAARPMISVSMMRRTKTPTPPVLRLRRTTRQHPRQQTRHLPPLIQSQAMTTQIAQKVPTQKVGATMAATSSRLTCLPRLMCRQQQRLRRTHRR